MKVRAGRVIAVGVTAIVVAGAAAGVWGVSAAAQQARVQAAEHHHALVVELTQHVSRVGDQTVGETDAQAEQAAAHETEVKAAQAAAAQAAAKAAAAKTTTVNTAHQSATTQQTTQQTAVQQPSQQATQTTTVTYHGPQHWSGTPQPAGAHVPMIVDDDPNSGQYNQSVPEYDQSYCATGGLSTVGGVIECAN